MEGVALTVPDRQPSLTALTVEFPELTPMVRRIRRIVDPPGRPDLPAHITLVYPWVPPPVATADLDRLSAYAAGIAGFEFRLVDVSWFGDEVIWLRPDPDEPFRAIIRDLTGMWPQHPPYRGEHPDPAPHLTIGAGGDVPTMRAMADTVLSLLPLVGHATELTLMEGSEEPEEWRSVATFPLGVSR